MPNQRRMRPSPKGLTLKSHIRRASELAQKHHGSPSFRAIIEDHIDACGLRSTKGEQYIRDLMLRPQYDPKEFASK